MLLNKGEVFSKFKYIFKHQAGPKFTKNIVNVRFENHYSSQCEVEKPN